ncbi:hypothetical protein RB601_002156 [Gaeumannomyces tritici]
MLYCINLIHDDTFSAVLAFLIWSLPGALGMFALSVGISNIQETLPRAVYALLSGLNSATVGIIALAAIELAQKAVTDKLTRLIVSVTGAAGLLYNALWYFPALRRNYRLNMSWRTSAVLLGGFFAAFAAVMATRAAVPHRPLLFSLFSNLFLAGTIIFGGGPVVIPLLREYVVAQG